MSIDVGNTQFRWDSDLLRRMQSAAAGSGGPSAAETMQQGLFDKAIQRAFGLMRSNRAANPAMAARMGQQAQAQLTGEAAQQAAMLRAQEQQQAVAQYLQALMGQQQGFYQGKGLELQQQQYNDAQQDAWGKMILGGLLNAGGSALSSFIG